MLARRWRGDPAILAWDLTDEPPLWLFPDTTDDEARAWTSALAGSPSARPTPTTSSRSGPPARRSAPGRSGPTSSAALLDFTTVHPYPIYSPELYPDSLLGAPDDPRRARSRRRSPAGRAGR